MKFEWTEWGNVNGKFEMKINEKCLNDQKIRSTGQRNAFTSG